MVGNQAKKNRVDRERKLHRVREKVFTKNEKVIVIKLKLLTSVKTVRLSIPYRPIIRYTQPPCFIPEKIPAGTGRTGRYRKKFFLFFFFKFCNF